MRRNWRFAAMAVVLAGVGLGLYGAVEYVREAAARSR